tara:strand:+ start:943 stop:1260 length:318 start_codon:yes stop_codon:yes gene_type:complete
MAAEYWVSGSAVIDKTSEDNEVLGIVIEKEEVDNNCYVYEENWLTVEMFLRCQTQWRVGISGIVGLDYTTVLEMIKLYSVQDAVSLMENLQIMEAAILKIINSDK